MLTGFVRTEPLNRFHQIMQLVLTHKYAYFNRFKLRVWLNCLYCNYILIPCFVYAVYRKHTVYYVHSNTYSKHLSSFIQCIIHMIIRLHIYIQLYTDIYIYTVYKYVCMEIYPLQKSCCKVTYKWGNLPPGYILGSYFCILANTYSYLFLIIIF